MKLFPALSWILSSAILLAEPTQPIDIFAIDENPGAGTLSYTLENNTVEKITFGKLPGNYGFGMIFEGAALPEPFKKDFEKSQILQMALGATKEKSVGRIPQFGTATLITNRIPKVKTVFRLTVPNHEELKKQNVALLLFSSPSSKLNQSDEEKLKETLFAQTGTITLTPLRTPAAFIVKDQNKKFPFLRQPFRTEFAAELSTPFSKSVRKLTGTVDFYYYWPNGKEAVAFANQIAADSFNSLSGVAPPPKNK